MLPKAVELLKDLFSEQELESMYRRPSEHPPEMKQQNDELAQWVNGMDIYTLSRLLGHEKVSITQIYLQNMQDAQIVENAVNSSVIATLK